MGLKLFQILDTSTNKVVPNLYFTDKQLAKAKRRELNGNSEPETLRHVVVPGPDHRRYRQ